MSGGTVDGLESGAYHVIPVSVLGRIRFGGCRQLCTRTMLSGCLNLPFPCGPDPQANAKLHDATADEAGAGA